MADVTQEKPAWRLPFGFVGLGTWVNTFSVLGGAFLGMIAKSAIPAELNATVLSGLGLVTVCLAIKMFFASKNVLIVALALAVGCIVGTLLGIQNAVDGLAEWAKSRFGNLGSDSETFTEGFVTASILFCVGPMTLMGCLQESIERKVDLIMVKSTLDFFAAMFLAMSLGIGVLASAGVVLVAQGFLTLIGGLLANIAKDDHYMSEATGVGGPILLATGLGLLDIKSLPTADYVPALVLAPFLVFLAQRTQRKASATVPPSP